MTTKPVPTRKKEAKDWLRRHSPPFGDYIEIPMPQGADAVLICARVGLRGLVPIEVCLPHHTYVKKLNEIKRAHNAEDIHLIPYNAAAGVVYKG